MTQPTLKPKIVIVDGRPMTTSLAVAEHFQKRHGHVVRAIAEKVRLLNDAGWTDIHFPQVDYFIEGQSRPYPMYRLSKIGFAMIAMGFVGTRALAWQRRYAEIFEGMEQAARRDQVTHSANDSSAQDAKINHLTARVAFLETAIFAGDKKEVDERVTLFNLLVKMRRDFGALAMVKTRYVADQTRVSSAEIHNRLIYALTKPEAALLWALIQAMGQSQYDREVKISVKDLLLNLVPAIKSPNTVTKAALRLASRGLIAIQPGHPATYEVHLEKVFLLLEEFDGKWLGVDSMNSKHMVPGVTDIERRHGDAALRFDAILPKKSQTLIRRVESMNFIQPVLPEKWLGLERVFRLLPDPYTGANAVELVEPSESDPDTRH